MVQNNKYWYLRNHKLFDQLNSEEIEELCIISNMKNAEKNDVIFFNDSEIKKIYILKVGTVTICREHENGKEIITEILTQGDIFGHINNSSSRMEYAKVLKSLDIPFSQAAVHRRVIARASTVRHASGRIW